MMRSKRRYAMEEYGDDYVNVICLIVLLICGNLVLRKMIIYYFDFCCFTVNGFLYVSLCFELMA